MTKRMKGNALPIALILLLVLTVLGVTGLRMAGTELKIAGAVQSFTAAFFDAESAIEITLASKEFMDNMPPTTEPVTIAPGVSVETTREYLDSGPVPGGGYSIADGKFSAYHFSVDAAGSVNQAEVEMLQGFYVVARGGN